MEEVLNGGIAVEYICRVIDETDGKECVPETATVAQTNLNGKNRSRESGKTGAKDASDSKTSAYLNSAMSVAMPALNGFTDGIAGQVIGKGKQVVNLTKAISSGLGASAVISAAAPLVAWGVSEAVQAYQNTKASNDALAQSLDATNLRRQMAGLSKINYTRSGITGKIRMEEQR